MGQDWQFHVDNATTAIQLPAPRWIVYAGTNPPGLYWLAAFVYFVTGSSAYIAATSVVLVGLNLIALGVWARLARKTMEHPSLRLALLLTLTFVPFRLIHSEVFAADALVVLPFTLVPWLFNELVDATSPRRQVAIIFGLLAVLVVGISSKYTMASAVPVALALLLVLRRRLATRRVFTCAVLLAVVIPGIFAWEQSRIVARLPADATGRQVWGHAMSWRSLLLVRASDPDVLQAPAYLETARLAGDDVYNLLVDNRHSYLALLHLSMFTDVLNIFQSDPTDSPFGTRDDLHQALMTAAVRSSLPLTLLLIVAMAFHTFRAPSYLLGLGTAPPGKKLIVTTVLAVSAAFFANIVLLLPFVQRAYHDGYWLARLVMPPLLGFLWLAFAFLDERLRSPASRVVVLAYALGQAALHGSFLWVRGP
jgi:hypothetical protein